MKQLPSLNGLRAVSIFAVIISHLILFNLRGNLILFTIPIFEGQFGVNVFFVISGFLITTLLLEEEKAAGTISLKNFYIRRVLRTFPAYYFLLFVYWLLQRAGYLHIPGSLWLTSLTYTKYLNVGEFYTDHAWSLSVEENFYLLWPVIFLLGDQWRKNTAAFLFFIVPVIRYYLFFIHHVRWINDLSLFVRIDAIAIGCYIALYKEELIQSFTGRWNKLFVIVLVSLLSIPWLAQLGIGNVFGNILIPIGTYYGTLANLAIAYILLYSVYGPQNAWFRFLNSKPLNYIGILSYSIYLWQQLFVKRTDWWVTHFPQNILCIALAALFSRYVIEKPFLGLKSRFYGKKVAKAAITQPI